MGTCSMNFGDSPRLSFETLSLSFRFSGTIVGVENISSHWEDSKWRSLKVSICTGVPFFFVFLHSNHIIDGTTKKHSIKQKKKTNNC